MLAGVGMWLGSALVIVLMLNATFYPLGLYLLLCSVGILTYVAQATTLPAFSRFVELSQRYAMLAALLSTLWMFLLLSVVQVGTGWTWEAALLLFVLTFTAQPLFTEARLWLTHMMFPGQADGEGLTRALADSEARAAHAQRLAEIGTMASAVAHEVRNPLGVITACVTVLERQGADAATLAEIRAQVDRAARFSDELLEYGRPAPLRRRNVEVADIAEVAASEVQRALGAAIEVHVDGRASLNADYAALVRLFGVLIENATLAGATTLWIQVKREPSGITVQVDDDGPGVPDAIAEKLFTAFVSGRGRSGPRPGTGLGLSIARGIAERHAGTLTLAGRSLQGGARFTLTIPVPAP